MTYRDRHPGDDVELLVDGGVEYKLRLSKSNKKGGGYMNVVNVRDKGEYHVKIKVAGGGQQMLPGKACTTPQEAALRDAKFFANPHAIVKKDPFRAKKGEGKVRAPPWPARVWCSHPHLFSAPFSQKRQRRVAQAKAQAEVPLCTSWPPWVVCNQSYNLWLSGVELPSELQLSVEAEEQIASIRMWAAERMDEGEEEEEEGALPPPPPLNSLPPTEPTAMVSLILDATPGPVAAWATEETLARVQAIKAAAVPARQSPGSVMANM